MPPDIKGAQSLLKKLRRMPEAAKAEIKIAMAAQADETVAFMKRLVPVDRGVLRDSIGWRWGSSAPEGSMAVVSKGSGDLKITIYAGDKQAFYAAFVEFGTVKMHAEPFFFPGWRASRKGAKNKIRAAIRKAARSVAAEG